MAAILLLFGIPRRLPLGLTYPMIQVIVFLAFVGIAVHRPRVPPRHLVYQKPREAAGRWPTGPARGYVRENLREVGGGFERWRAGNLSGGASLLEALLVPAGAGLLGWEVDVRYSEELQSILSRFGAGPAPKDQVVQYLSRQSSETTEQDAGGVLTDLEDEGYVEMVSGEKGELVRFTERAIDEVLG